MASKSIIRWGQNKLFAIPLKNSEHRKWVDNDEFSDLEFSWDDIAVAPWENKQMIDIAVAQQYSSYKPQIVKSISDGIYQFSRLNTGDGIIGISENNGISKLGYISQPPQKEKRKVVATIQWVKNFNSPKMQLNLLDNNSEIQRLTSRIIQKLPIPEEFLSEIYYKAEELKSKGYFNASEASLQQEMIEYKKDPGGELELFYGTNRERTSENDVKNYYNEKLSELKVGICRVSIPPGHKQGEIERPRRVLLWQFNENKNKHIIVSSIKQHDYEDFNAWLIKELKKSDSKSALVFIHGYNTTFIEAAWRTAQITYDIPFNNGVSGFFSWPSSGKALSYAKDIERADASIPDLITFIEDLVNKSGVEQLHFIAHSMGNRILTRALNKLAEKETFKDKIKTISQVILAAPDIDKDVFDKDILPVFKSIGLRRTLYASDRDIAMRVSKNIRIDLERIGEGGDNIYIAEGLDTIDASNVMSDGIHHSYIFETKELLGDLSLVIQGLDPLSRRLREARKNDLKFWLFRE